MTPDHVSLLIAFAALVFLGVLLKPHPIPWEGKGAAGPAPASISNQVASWHPAVYFGSVTKDATLSVNYPTSGSGAGPIVTATYQGFAGGISWGDESRYLYISTQEGDTGIMKVDTNSAQSPLLTGYFVNNATYNNLIPVSQKGGYLVAGNSISDNANAYVTSTMNGAWIGLSTAGEILACANDGTWAYFAQETNPGTVLIVNLINSSSQLTNGQVSDDWSNNGSNSVYSLDVDSSSSVLLAVSLNGTAYLFDTSTLPSNIPTLASTSFGSSALHAGCVSGHRAYIGGNGFISTFDITTKTSPKLLAVFANPHSTDQFDKMVMDRTNNLVYACYGGEGADADPSAVLVLNASTATLSEVTGSNFSGGSQGSITANMGCEYCAVSPNGNRFAMAYGGFNSPGGVRVWDVSGLAGGSSSAGVIQDIYCNAEPRGSIMTPGDSAPFVYTNARYNWQSLSSTNSLIQTLVDGNVYGNQVKTIGVSSGTDPHGSTQTMTPDWFLLPSGTAGGPDVIFHASSGTIASLNNVGTDSILHAQWTGKYLYALMNNVGNNGQFVIYVLQPTYSAGTWNLNTGSPVASYVSPYFTGTNSGAICVVGGDYGTAGCVAYVSWGWDPVNYPTSQYGSGIWLLDMSNTGNQGIVLYPSTGSFTLGNDPIFVNPASSPTVTGTTGGASDNNGLYAQFAIVYYDVNGINLGSTPYNSALQLTGSSTAWVVNTSGIIPPPEFNTWSLAQKWSFDNSTYFGPILDPNYQNESSATTSITYTPHIKIQSGSTPPAIGNPFPSAGGILENVYDATSGRIYVAWGDNGIRIYNNATKSLSGVITQSGNTNPTYGPLVSCGSLVLTTQGGIRWLVSNNYGSLGGIIRTGISFYNLTSNPDNPPVTFQSTAGAGFTVGASSNTGPGGGPMAWITSLSGFEGYVYS